MLELASPALLAERGETLLETTSTGFSLRGKTAMGSPLSKPVSELASPAAPTEKGELELETISTGSTSRGLRTMGEPSSKPVSELASPAAPTEKGELELETMSIGFSSGWGTGAVFEKASRERRVMKTEYCILEAGDGGGFIGGEEWLLDWSEKDGKSKQVD